MRIIESDKHALHPESPLIVRPQVQEIKDEIAEKMPALLTWLNKVPNECQYPACAKHMHGHKTESTAESMHHANKETRNKGPFRKTP